MNDTTDTLIIGAGPFGLSLGAYCQSKGLDFQIVGKPFEFWIENMPEGMFLRSASDWHIDPFSEETLVKFLANKQFSPEKAEPLSRNIYLEYLKWFVHQYQLEIHSHYVEILNFNASDIYPFEVKLDNGRMVKARNVVLAIGFKYFKNLPPNLVRLFPANRWKHTCDLVDLAKLSGKRCLIIGGRQSAFEWAAILNDEQAGKVYISYRHDSPEFKDADWTWVGPLVDQMLDNPGWFRRMDSDEKNKVERRLWAEGRLKIEPWLKDRVMTENTRIWPNTTVRSCIDLEQGDLQVELSNGKRLIVDMIILATGYKVNVANIPFLCKGNILSLLKTQNDFPVLDNHFQTNIPGLYMTSMAATQDFGPFFAFTISVKTSAKLIGQALARL